MQKILIISTKNLLSNHFDGAQKRIFDISKSLSKKNKVDFVCLGENLSKKKTNLNFLNKLIVYNTGFFFKIYNVIISILKFQPMQNGYFFSKDIYHFVSENKQEYDVIIFHLIRSAQYLPDNFSGKTILEMTDLISSNYAQVIKELSFFNPLKYMYLFEKFLLQKYEKKVSNSFDKTIFVTEKELALAKGFIEKSKIYVVGNCFESKKKIFKYNTKSNKILFVGNITYLPNKLACYNFSKKILPEINKIYPEIEFNIVGKINVFDKLILSCFSNVKVHGPIKKIDKMIKKSICGISNLKVATGLQNKIFTYMSYGLPAIASKDSVPKNLVKNKKNILVFSSQNDLIRCISQLIEKKQLANLISKNSHKIVKNKLAAKKVYNKYI